MISVEAKQIRDSLTKEVLDSTPLEVKRNKWEAASKTLSTPCGVNVSSANIAGIPCLLCSPDKDDASQCQPSNAFLTSRDAVSNRVIVYCHGGGLVEGSAETFRVWGARLALRTGLRVVVVDYRLAPENPYPAAINDVFSVCRSLSSVLDNTQEIIIGADSTGSVLGLASMVEFKQNPAVNIVGGFFLSPSVDLTFSGKSITVNEDNDKFVSLPVLKHYARYYCDDANFSNPAVSPLFANLNSLSPLLVLADDSELLLDDAIRLDSAVKAEGGACVLRITQGLWHVWPLWGVFPEATTALDAIAEHVLNIT